MLEGDNGSKELPRTLIEMATALIKLGKKAWGQDLCARTGSGNNQVKV